MKRSTTAPLALVHRRWLLLLLLVTAQPAPLAASRSAPAEDGISAIAHPQAQVARSGSALEILQALERNAGSGTARSGSGSGWQPAAGTAEPAVHGLHCASILPPLVRVASPVCERLPYHATAPPSRR